MQVGRPLGQRKGRRRGRWTAETAVGRAEHSFHRWPAGEIVMTDNVEKCQRREQKPSVNGALTSSMQGNSSTAGWVSLAADIREQ